MCEVELQDLTAEERYELRLLIQKAINDLSEWLNQPLSDTPNNRALVQCSKVRIDRLTRLQRKLF